MNEPKDEGVTFDKAMEVHRLNIDDCLSPTQIAEKTGIDIFLVGRILAGRIFPGALRVRLRALRSTSHQRTMRITSALPI